MSGARGVAVPVLRGAAWAYDAAFLFAALVSVVFLVALVTVTVDPLAELFADRVAGEDADSEPESGATQAKSEATDTTADADESEGDEGSAG